MNTVLLMELDACMSLCDRLEQLLRQDMEEFPLSVTGEICDAYTASTETAIQSVTQLKQNIMVLHSSLQALL